MGLTLIELIGVLAKASAMYRLAEASCRTLDEYPWTHDQEHWDLVLGWLEKHIRARVKKLEALSEAISPAYSEYILKQIKL